MQNTILFSNYVNLAVWLAVISSEDLKTVFHDKISSRFLAKCTNIRLFTHFL